MASKQVHMARAVAISVTIALTLMVSSGSASASIDQCVRKKVTSGMDATKAMAECLKDVANPTKTTPPVLIKPSSSDADGTSIGLLALVGLGGIVLGAVAMMLLRKPGESPATPSAQPISGTDPVGKPSPGFAAPGVNVVTSVDRSRPLVASLIDLSDRVSSGALRAEIIAVLVQAGVQLIEPAQGAAFDANQMRGVGSALAPDPGWVGRVASTERVGFVDAGIVVRLPDVVVYTAGG